MCNLDIISAYFYGLFSLFFLVFWFCIKLYLDIRSFLFFLFSLLKHFDIFMNKTKDDKGRYELYIPSYKQLLSG